MTHFNLVLFWLVWLNFYCLSFQAKVGFLSSLFVGIFGGYWIKLLNTKEIDNLSEEYEHYTIKCIGKMFYKVQDVFTTVKYVIIMMIPRTIELLIIVYTWSFALGRKRKIVTYAEEDQLSLIWILLAATYKVIHTKQ